MKRFLALMGLLLAFTATGAINTSPGGGGAGGVSAATVTNIVNAIASTNSTLNKADKTNSFVIGSITVSNLTAGFQRIKIGDYIADGASLYDYNGVVQIGSGTSDRFLFQDHLGNAAMNLTANTGDLRPIGKLLAGGDIATTNGQFIGSAELFTNVPTRSLVSVPGARTPWMMLDTWNVYRSVSAVMSATNASTTLSDGVAAWNIARFLTNAVWEMSTNGMKDVGIDWIGITDGYQDRTNGVLYWSTNLFHFTPQWYTAWAHSKGLKVFVYNSASTNTCNVNGVASPINYIWQDIHTMMEWGADGVMLDWCDSSVPSDEYLRKYYRIVDRAIEHWNTTNTANGGSAKTFMVQGTVNLGSPYTMTVNNDVIEGINTFTPITPLVGTLTGSTLMTNLSGWMKAGQKASAWIRPGFFPQLQSDYGSTSYEYTNILAAYSMVCAPFRGQLAMNGSGLLPMSAASDADVTGNINTGWNTIRPYFTNRMFMELYKDAGCFPGRTVWSNNYVELWERPLGTETSRERQLLLMNYSGSTTNVGIGYTNFYGWPNTPYYYRDPWSGNAVLFTNAFTISQAENACTTLKVWPAVSDSGIFAGNGAGLTNLDGTSVNTFANSTLALSMVYASSVRFATNQASDFQIDFDKKRSLLATNNAVTFSSCLNVPTGTLTTNVASCMVTLTNTAGSANPKLITMATPFQNMNASQGNTIYITNLLKIVVSWQLGEGTNFWWVGR